MSPERVIDLDSPLEPVVTFYRNHIRTRAIFNFTNNYLTTGINRELNHEHRNHFQRLYWKHKDSVSVTHKHLSFEENQSIRFEISSNLRPHITTTKTFRQLKYSWWYDSRRPPPKKERLSPRVKAVIHQTEGTILKQKPDMQLRGANGAGNDQKQNTTLN